MKKVCLGLLCILVILFVENNKIKLIGANKSNEKTDDASSAENSLFASKYTYPDFYRGIYLTVSSASSYERLSALVQKAKKSNMNAVVLDVQYPNSKKCAVPSAHVKYCIENGLHPIARIVVFPDGLRYYPVPDKVISEKLEIAESSCKNGFKEIQFDYIRFSDSVVPKNLTLDQRYAFIEGFFKRAGEQLKKYRVKIAADVFGRIPLNRSDLIGQRMEGLDQVVDYICPMAYPSHYTWSQKLMSDPYYTVYTTSKQAAERTKKAEIVTYIQAFRMKIGNIPYNKYISDQIKAVHDAGVRGYVLWNARQDYDYPLAVVREYYANNKLTGEHKSKKISPEDKS